ncbi:MAG TPA: hypothetical protein VGC62_16375 [Pseudomonas sp.]|uniref:hypothetical protein n=1 Tax=Pseudomonas sp. TaxID=306 RepID=UPI002EDB17DF
MDDLPLTLDLFFSTVERQLSEQLPGLKTVATWPDIRERIHLPALFLELAELEPGTDPGNGRVGLVCRFDAYLIVAAELARHHHQAAQLATQLAVFLRAQYWGLNDVDAAEFVQAGPDWTKPELDSYTVWKVEWTQQIYLGEEQWPWPDVAPTFLEPELDPEQVQIDPVLS